MRTLFNDTEIAQGLCRQAAKFSVVPLAFLLPVFVFNIEVESIYDFVLEVTRLYCVILIASMAEKLINLRVVHIGLAIAIANGCYDAATEVVYLENAITTKFPFADALLDEALLIISYGCIIMGLFHYLRQVNKLSLTDQLTKCYTRSALELMPSGHFQIFYLDLDKFKQINDTKGHNIGDRVLTLFGRRLIRCCDDIGYAFRIGGDEFLAIVDIHHAHSFIDTFTKTCQVEEIAFSYGTALCENGNFAAAISEADENLYEMKQFKDSNYPFSYPV
ncbi:GGDEF domain-containing protein [Vibrio taketomensis]|uniref:GGDEF domain-containing protein n=1 Tax=Vibrio taketomensis TaxID=2572923 RepID=UPI001389A3FF|nr:GGDEF domain-containing protein [Vibrio taketomensis]